MEKTEEQKQFENIQAEMMFVGSLYSDPDLYISYGSFVRSKYDFADEAAKFFYDMFEIMYTKFSEVLEEAQVNLFMTKDNDRLKKYKRFGGWRTISDWKTLSNKNDFDKYYNLVKKYSLLREYNRKGFPALRILSHPKFEQLTANDIYKLIRSQADKINTVISANEESVDLLQGNKDLINSYLVKPDIGLSFPWKLISSMSRGIRTGRFFLCGFLSNAGKTRNLVYLAAYIVLIHKEKFLLMSNEMSEQDLRNCLVTTVLNNKDFQELHGIEMRKPESEIVSALYRRTGSKYSDNDFILRKTDPETNAFLETEDEYRNRLSKESEEYNKVMAVADWIDNNEDGNLYFKDMGSDYSDNSIEFEMRKHRTLYDVKYMGYDTLKAYQDLGDWSVLKKTATRFKEIANEIKVFVWADMQLTDDTVFTDVTELSSNNISSCKAIKHVADFLILGKRIAPEDYNKYRYIPTRVWVSSESEVPPRLELNPKKVYFGMKIDKNRAGNKDYLPLIEQDLDINQWKEIGSLVKRGY